METVNIKAIQLDLKNPKLTTIGDFIQNDTNIIKFTLVENGNVINLNNVDQILINYQKPNNEVISRIVTVENNVITYQLGFSEMNEPGLGKLVLQLFKNDNRISTFIVNVNVKKSIEANFSFEEDNKPLISQLFDTVNTLLARIEILESIIDNGAPPTTNTPPNITSTFNLTNTNDSTSIVIPFIVSDVQGGNITATFTKNGIPTTTNISTGSNNWNVGILPIGNHVLKIKVKDSGGLTSNELTFNITVIRTETGNPNPPIEENLIYTWVGAVI